MTVYSEHCTLTPNHNLFFLTFGWNKLLKCNIYTMLLVLQLAISVLHEIQPVSCHATLSRSGARLSNQS